MTYLTASLLGIVQGLTEFLPVSSTAHLLITERALGFEHPDPAFTVMIQLGSILAIVWLYRTKILRVLTGLTSDGDARRFAGVLMVAFIPAALAGAFLAKYVTTVLYDSPMVIATTFVVGGVIMLLVERYRPTPDVLDAERTPVGRALGVGVCQMLALIPGVSRSGATIVGGLAMRLDRAAAAEFSFFLAIPTLAAAFAKGLLDLRGHATTGQAMEIAIGLVMAFLASLVVIRPFLAFVRRAGFAPFAWYRIVAGLALFGAVAAGWA